MGRVSSEAQTLHQVNTKHHTTYFCSGRSSGSLQLHLVLQYIVFFSQSVEERCTERLRTAEEELSGRQEEVKKALVAVQKQNSLDLTVLDQQQAELQDHMKTAQQMVHDFLQEELQQDVPTGTSSVFVCLCVCTIAPPPKSNPNV